ncbi:ATP-binding protein [Sphingobacterium sp. LRF_L2]|uniref:ATP-binding protein n=1 Tax=Sphingobacterium sp. LRF_L2 TaxID=3369421 RepID=UPI003F62365E
MITIPAPQYKRMEDNFMLQALQFSPEPTAIYAEENMIIQFANKGMLALWGKDASVVGKPLLEAIPELIDQPFLSILQTVWNTSQSYAVTGAPAELIHDGIRKIGYYDYEYKAILSENGETRCILNTAREVTSEKEYLQSLNEREKTEKLLKEQMSMTLENLNAKNQDLLASMMLLSESREHVRTIIEQAPVGIAMLKGPEHVIEIANHAILQIWGREGSDVIGLPHRIARPELKGQPVYDWLDKVYSSGVRKTNKEFAVSLYHEGGLRKAIVNSIYQPIFSGEGEVTGVLVILEDITEQVIARRENEKDQHMLALAIDAGQLATFYYEPATNLFSGNQLLHAWFGLRSRGQIDLSQALEVIIDDDRQRVVAAINHALSAESTGEYAIEYRIKAPQEANARLVQATGQVLYDSRGNAVSLNGTLRDITEQKKDEQRKDDFIGMVSHELKTPLTSLKAYLQLMQRGIVLSEDYDPKNALDKSLRQVGTMTMMINGFLNISRLDAGKMVLNRNYFNFKTLFSELQEEMSHMIQSHQVIFELSENIDLYADREKISLVIHNLVGNAIKYSPVGSSVVLSYSAADNNIFNVRVSDEGMGIGMEDQHKIFDRYYRVESAKMGSISGFGIGLYLCREIMELHKGSIVVECSGEKGTTFKLTLPLQYQPE